MTTDEKLTLTQTLITAAEPLIAAIISTHPDPAKAAETLQDLVAKAIAGPGVLAAAEKADDAAADKALHDRFDLDMSEPKEP